jgi:uncharacterized membrane protein YiaA
MKTKDMNKGYRFIVMVWGKYGGFYVKKKIAAKTREKAEAIAIKESLDDDAREVVLVTKDKSTGSYKRLAIANNGVLTLLS